MAYYIDISTLLNNTSIEAEDVTDPLNALDSIVNEVVTGTELFTSAGFAQQTSIGTPSGTDGQLYLKSDGLYIKRSGSDARITTLTDFASPPTIGSTTRGIGYFSTVGIGTSSPTLALEVHAAAATQFRVKSIGANRASFVIDTGAAAQQSVFTLVSDGSDKWQIGNNGNNTFFIYDVTNTRIVIGTNTSGDLQLMTSGGSVTLGSGGGTIGFFGATAVTKRTVTGSRGGNVALASALTALANLGLITDSSTA